jgi:chromosome segregation ATPase
MNYYSDPVQGLLQSSGPTALSDIHSRQDQLAKKQADVAVDQAAIDNLQDELRREGGDPGWLRNVAPGEPRASAAEQPGAQGEKDWDARFKAARARLADAEEQLQVTQDELKLLRIQDVRTLDSSSKAELDGKVKDKEDEVAQKQQEKDEAQKALEKLQQEFDAAGAQEEIVKQ